MPIYEYECTSCGDQFEAIQGFSDKPLKKCEKCGGRLHKLVSECSFQLKGSGWYVTDYGGKKGADKPKSKNGGKPADKGKDKSQTKTETKPETVSGSSTSSSGKSKE
jgi:putative FmdB family regulatory protein